jgi:hypothetical protein
MGLHVNEVKEGDGSAGLIGFISSSRFPDTSWQSERSDFIPG